MQTPLVLRFENKSPFPLKIHHTAMLCCVVCVVIPFILDVRLVDAPVGVTQEEGHTGFLFHLPPAVLALIFSGG